VTAYARNLLLVLGAAALAMVLGLYAYFGVLRGEERRAKEKEAKERLVAPVAQPDGGTELIRYDRLVLTSGADSTELGRLPDASWVFIRPFRARADPRPAEDVISTLQSLRLTRVVEEQPNDEDLQRYGLKPPRFIVTASAYGAPSLTVSGGVDNPFDGSVYVQRAGDGRVYAVEGFVSTSLGKRMEDLRAKDVLGPRDLGLLGVELTSARHTWAVARQPEQPWLFQKPSTLPADGTSISSWVAKLSGQRAVKFLVDSPSERARTGMAKPSVQASFRRNEETIRVRLAAGPLDADPVYALREDSFGATLAEVPRTALATLDIPAAELRDRRVLVFEPAQVERIRILPEGGGPTFVVQREAADAGARWLLASRTPQQASTAKVSTLLYNLASLKWAPTEALPPKDPGLGATARTLVLEDGTGKVLGTLVLGKTASRMDNTVWSRSAAGEVVQVDLGRLMGLPARPEDLLELVATPGPADAAH
jgi:hypothetical protein